MGGASIRELPREGFWRKAQISWDFLDVSGSVLSCLPHLPATSPAENWELLLAGLQTSCRARKHEISVHSALLPQLCPSSPLPPPLNFSLLSKVGSSLAKTAFSKVFATLVS